MMVKKVAPLAMFLVLLMPALADAQASRMGPSAAVSIIKPPLVRNPDVAIDTAHNVFLAATGNGFAQGAFLTTAGAPVGAPFRISQTAGYVQSVRAKYNAAADAFLVTWHEGSAPGGKNWVKARLVRYPTGAIGNEVVISAPRTFWEFGPEIASSGSEFLVTWVQVNTSYDIYARRVSAGGAPLGAPIPVSTAAEFEREPTAAYNPASNEYLVAWGASSDTPKYATINVRRLKPGSDTPIAPAGLIQKTSVTYLPSLAVNTATNQYLLTWYKPGAIYAAFLNADGSVAKAPYPVNTRFATYDGNDLAYNPASGTYFGVGHSDSYEDSGFEISSAGVPSSPFYITATAGILGPSKPIYGNYNPKIAASSVEKRWMVVTSTNYGQLTRQVIQTASNDGGAAVGNPPPRSAPGSQPALYIDTPVSGATVTQPFAVMGWAIDSGAASGTGIDVVHVYAYPNPGSGQPAVFLGAASYGSARPDVGAAHDDSQFNNSGFSRVVDGLQAGTYQIVAFGRSTVTSTFSVSKSTTVSVRGPLMDMSVAVGAPNARPLVVSGWAVDQTAPSGTGVDLVNVYAYPNPGSGAPAIFLGAAGYGIPRPDVAAKVGGARFTNCGFVLSVTSLNKGNYRIVAFAHSSSRDAFTNNRAIDVNIGAGSMIAVDTPSNNAVVSSGFVVSGWAFDLNAPSGTGIDAVHVWAFPISGAAPKFLGAAGLGGVRADVAAVFGSRTTTSGYAVTTVPLPPGLYSVVVYSHSTATRTFNNAATRLVTVR
jgi:hypothetical protein